VGDRAVADAAPLPDPDRALDRDEPVAGLLADPLLDLADDPLAA
jgi:hypothetical protein